MDVGMATAFLAHDAANISTAAITSSISLQSGSPCLLPETIMDELLIKQSSLEGDKHPIRPLTIRPLTNDLFEFVARLGLFCLLVYWSFVLIRPFLSIILWSLILTVTLYPAFDWTARRLEGRRKLAAAIVTALAVLIFTGPVIWLGLSMVEGLGTLYGRLNAGAITIPSPPEEIKTWPFVGERLHSFWTLASANLMTALNEALPYLQPLKSPVRRMAQSAATGIPMFLLSVVIAGFLFSPAPSLLEVLRKFSFRILPAHGQEFLKLAAKTIRNVSQGVIGIALLQAILAGLGFVIAGVPGSGFLALAVLILGILQFPGIVLIPVIIWSWTSMQTTAALAFTAYMVPVSLMDNVLRPILMARGLKTPMLVILIGVMGGALTHGIIGLFLGPIVLAVTWELIGAWLQREDALTIREPAADPQTSNGIEEKPLLGRD